MAPTRLNWIPNVEYVQAKNNNITVFLLRNPLWEEDDDKGPMITDDFGRTVPIQDHINVAQTLDRYKERILKA